MYIVHPFVVVKKLNCNGIDLIDGVSADDNGLKTYKNKYNFEIMYCETIPYSISWENNLRNAFHQKTALIEDLKCAILKILSARKYITLHYI